MSYRLCKIIVSVILLSVHQLQRNGNNYKLAGFLAGLDVHVCGCSVISDGVGGLGIRT